MANLILTAENFAFGPISKLLFIANLLHEQGHRMEFAGYGSSLQLAKHFPFDAIYEIDTEDANSEEKLSEFISKGDMLISSMDLPSVLIAKEHGVLVVWVDCLFWFWDEIFEDVLDVDLFVRELSVDDSVNEIKFGKKIKNLLTVGPILGEMKSKKRGPQVLVSYGGGEATHWYKVGRDTNYPSLMTHILNKYVSWNGFDKVIIATGQKIVEDLKVEFSETPLHFMCLPQNVFLDELLQSEILITTAGLVTTESAFQYKTPVLFLPSSNDSHYMLLEKMRMQNLAPASVELSDFLPHLELNEGTVEENIAAVMKQLKQVEESEKLQEKIGTQINMLLKNREQWSIDSIEEGKKFIDSLGGNGAVEVVEQIEKILQSRNL